jgi:hypothetical protein
MCTKVLSQKGVGLRKRIKEMLARKNVRDDFDWNRYSTEYQEQLEEIARVHTEVLTAGDYVFQNDRLQLRRDILPLHPNHQLLYETVLQMNPSSAMEIGCGSGDHLHNLGLLDPSIDLYGVDRSAEQIRLLHKRHPGIAANVVRMDATVVQGARTVCDLAFTQAVIMHIQTKTHHLVALENLFRCARRHVVLMENWTRHAFMDDIRGLFEGGRIPWSDLHFHYRASETDAATRIMVLSAMDLADYPTLTDYDTLLAHSEG